ncbi:MULTISPECIES: glycosyl transferase family protein [Acinetobacter]|uniref:Glycosyl transferase family protein n=1 Tax=Acinetobacter towneri TaxID=202956 RepID=A0ABX7TGF1_9GAMM|nr:MULTISPECIES: glycosyl transferase family protein [Acinetobacter]MCA4788666.1 glycosyl transferase family protein [Acinetobacter towneri]MCO8055753.1 glycosyl transferase family protein [Acinetobacter towneri]QTD58691.1 glycosyl transferase family protein [Acinetobacter towneri]QTD62789.1 glycosyl transferase family protein [Acinetobacter towneri]WPC31240.1 glycosyl transferase family protein [Acinetobacter towneri]
MPNTNPNKRNIYKDAEHPFAQFIRIIGKGKTGARSLTYDEAYQAFSMILRNEVLDVQLGAFLMLLRVKEESVEELAGFVQATRDQLQFKPLQVDLDWSSYAGKRRHYPWFLLAALTLAKHGYKVVMHGASGHTINRLYTEQALQYLDYPICQNDLDVEQQLAQRNFAYLPLDVISPILSELINLRNVMGLRSPIHTLARLINPFNAKATMQAIFHPAYRSSHQQAAFQLGYQNSAVIKGEGGEFERNPDAKTLICGIKNGALYEHELPKLTDNRSPIEEELDLAVFKAVWLDQQTHEYGEVAITETIGIALYTMGVCDDYAVAMQNAQQLWQNRHN